MMTSVKISVMARAASASSVRLTATMPPKADVESQASALLVGAEQIGALGDAAGVGVLDDDAGRGARRVELGDAFIGRIGVVDVVVRQLLALQAARKVETPGRLSGVA